MKHRGAGTCSGNSDTGDCSDVEDCEGGAGATWLGGREDIGEVDTDVEFVLDNGGGEILQKRCRWGEYCRVSLRDPKLLLRVSTGRNRARSWRRPSLT